MSLDKNMIPKSLSILIIFSIFLNFVHLVWSDSIFSLFIIWNIVLALIPFIISLKLLNYFQNEGKSTVIYLVGIVFWFIFLPNAPYLVTDIIHVGENIGVPLWFDALTLFVSACAGILLGLYSLWHFEKLLFSKFSKKISVFCFYLAILFSSFGVYLGRFLRWNSWDIFTSPKDLFKDIYSIFLNAKDLKEATVFTIIFFFFITTFYYIWKINNKEKITQ